MSPALSPNPTHTPHTRTRTEQLDVSVCIVNWNCRDILRGCLQSLQHHLQGVTLEIIVVDNASTDGAPAMVATEFPHVQLIRNPTNTGFSHGNNQAAATATGRYLFFLNNDTVVPPGTLRELLDYAESHPEAGLIGPRLRDSAGHVQVSYRNQPTYTTLMQRTTLLRWTTLLGGSYHKYRREDFDSDHTREVAVLMGAAMFTPRDAFLSWGGWDEDFTFGGEDMELSIRAGLHTKLVYFPEVEILHYGRTSTRQHLPASAHIAAGLVRYLRKTGTGRLGVLAYKCVVMLDAPICLAAKVVEYLIRRLRGRDEKAKKSWLSVQVVWHFLTRGLVEFWRA